MYGTWDAEEGIPAICGRMLAGVNALFNLGSTVGSGMSFGYFSFDKRKLPGSCIGQKKGSQGR